MHLQPSEIFLYILIGAVVFFYLRRFLMTRSLRHYSPSELVERMDTDRNVVLLDVRSRSERQNSHIQGSLHIPLHQLAGRVEELRKYQGREIVCYCQTGSRSVAAAVRLNKLGFQASNLKGGIAEWNFQNR